MIKYNLCLIRQGNKILLLNRERSPWMGCWTKEGIGDCHYRKDIVIS